ncbi:MAG: DUF2812 domain-containing protein [Acetatifactor sp.]|nr:DUF2812 domain-containing protein [Acetatifactor sp.]
MRRVIHKLFFIWDFGKEERWLNEMAAKGLSLISVKFLTYEFENTLPGEYQIRTQVLEHLLSHPETESYIHFLEETGVQHVGTCVRQAYFRKKTAEGQFELFSDNASRIKHLNYIITLLCILLIPNFSNGINQLLMYIQYQYPVNLFALLSIIFVEGLIITGIIKLSLKRKKLKEEQQIFE